MGELRAGRKRTHWMWFIFPQLRGLGHSSTAQFYGIGSLDEARAYLEHPLLGARLIECVQIVLNHRSRPLDTMFGAPDDRKFHSSVSLFALATAAPANVFSEALDCFAGGVVDEPTRVILQSSTRKGSPPTR